MSVYDLIKKNRSYRGYDESYTFTREQLEHFVDGARLTASSVNMQPLKYFIAYDKADVDTIHPNVFWARNLPKMKLPHEGKKPTGFIVICQDLSINDRTDRFLKDVGIVAQSILLMAVEEGLGGCMIGNFKPTTIQKVLNLPDHLYPLLVVALGKPDEEIIIKEIEEGEDTKYYRDEQDRHYVPKRKLKDIIIND